MTLSLKSLFKRIFASNLDQRQSMAVITYPEHILFETYHQIKHSYQIRSDEISVFDRTITESEIGEAILKHLSLSRYGINDPDIESYKKSRENYKKITRLKTIKAQMKDAHYIHVDRENGNLTFTPSINGGSSGTQRGYRPISDSVIKISDAESFETIGRTLIDALQKCKTI